MKSTIVCLVIAAVFVYASAMPAVGDTAAPGTPAAPKTPPAAPGVAPVAPAVAPAGEAAPGAPSIPAQIPSNPVAFIKTAAENTMKAFEVALKSFGR